MSKEEFFVVVFEWIYKLICEVECELNLFDLELVEVVRLLVVFIWNYYFEYFEFIRLLNMENVIGVSYVIVFLNF